MVTLLIVWFYWLIIVLKSACECVLWINGIELKWFLVWIVETELDELWCLLTWITWTIVNAYWSIGPLQSLVLKEHRWLLDIQYTPQGIDESLKGSKFVHFNSWLWQLKTHGHNATIWSWRESIGYSIKWGQMVLKGVISVHREIHGFQCLMLSCWRLSWKWYFLQFQTLNQPKNCGFNPKMWF